MKTSTKNAIIGGTFTIIAAAIGTISFSIGKENQDNKIETTINQSGVITINQSESSSETIERLLDEYIKLQNNYNDISTEYIALENTYNTIKKKNDDLSNQLKNLENKNDSLNKKIVVQKALENNELSKINPDRYLFDSDPFMLENINIYMRNNDVNTIHNYSNYYYNDGYVMTSNGIKYYKGITVTVDSSKQSILYYNLEGKYSILTGYAAFEDESGERADKCYKITFYADNNPIDEFIINKGEMPTEININIINCSILKIILESPSGDASNNPDINLIEFGLYE